MVSRALCEVCKQPKWIYDLNEYGQKIQIGVWSDGGPKYKVHGHQCAGTNYANAPGTKLDKLHQHVDEAINYVDQRATDSAEFVKDRAQSNHVNIHAMAADIALVKEDMQTCKHHLETLVKKAGMFQGADTMVRQDPANMGPPPKRPDLHDVQMPAVDKNESDYDDDENEVVDEIAGTDDTTHTDDTGSINFVNAPEVRPQQ